MDRIPKNEDRSQTSVSRKHSNIFTIELVILLTLYSLLFFFAYCITDSFTEMSKIEKHTSFFCCF